MFYDRDTPAGKEYALPLQEARSQGNNAETGNAKGPPALFGAGIRKADTAAATANPRGGTADERSGATGRAQDKSRSVTPPQSSESRVTPTPSRSSQVSDSGASGISVGLGIGIAVLLGGLALSLVLRRHHRASAA